MKNNLLLTTALVSVAFAVSNAQAEEAAKNDYTSLIVESDVTSHDSSSARININGEDVKVENDVTLGHWVTVHDGSKLTGGHKMTVQGYLTVDGIKSGVEKWKDLKGVDLSGIDLRIEKGTSGITEGELIIGQNSNPNNEEKGKPLTVGNVEMADGTNIYLYNNKPKNGTAHYLDISENKTLTFEEGDHLIYGGNGTNTTDDQKYVGLAPLIITGQGNGANIENKGKVVASYNLELKNINYHSDGGWLGRDTHTESTERAKGDEDFTITVDGGNISLENGARIVAVHTHDNNDASVESGTILLNDLDTISVKNGANIDAVDFTIDGDTDDKGIIRTKVYIGGTDADGNKAYIAGYDDENTIDGAEVTIDDGGMLLQGALGDGTAKNDKGNMFIENATINVKKGGVMKSINKSTFTLDDEDAVINLEGEIDGIIGGENVGTINVNSAEAKIKSIQETAEGGLLKDLNINADTSSGSLFGGKAELKRMTVTGGHEFTLDNTKLFTANKVVIQKDATLHVDDAYYDIAKTAVAGTLDLGTSTYDSAVTLKDGSVLHVDVEKADNDILVNGKIRSDEDDYANLTVNGNATLDFYVTEEAGDVIDGQALNFGKVVTDELLKGEKSKLHAENVLYDLNVEGNQVVASKNSAERIASKAQEAGAGENASNAMSAFALEKNLDGKAKEIHDFMYEHLQKHDVNTVAALAEDVAPAFAPVVQTVETNQLAHAYGAVSANLSTNSIDTASAGKSSGDGVFDKAVVWVKALFNKSTVDDMSEAKGFDAKTKGVAFGAHHEVADNVKLGVAYAYGDTEIDGHHRDIDVDSHTFMLYGEYKPSNWYVNGIASYGMSKYKEKKSSLLGGFSGKYDVDVFGLQAMTGYEALAGSVNVTPEIGLRYAHLDQEAYTDTAGQRVKAEDQDILTAVADVKASKEVAFDNGISLRPEARLGVTYDLMDGDNSAVVNVGSSSYRVEGESLERFGVEAGVGLTASLNESWDISAGYEGKFRKDFEDHSGILSAKYKF